MKRYLAIAVSVGTLGLTVLPVIAAPGGGHAETV